LLACHPHAFDIKGTGFVIGVRIEGSGEQGLLNLEVVFAKTFAFESKGASSRTILS
jgi:hypothetical protein